MNNQDCLLLSEGGCFCHRLYCHCLCDHSSGGNRKEAKHPRLSMMKVGGGTEIGLGTKHEAELPVCVWWYPTEGMGLFLVLLVRSPSYFRVTYVYAEPTPPPKKNVQLYLSSLVSPSATLLLAAGKGGLGASYQLVLTLRNRTKPHQKTQRKRTTSHPNAFDLSPFQTKILIKKSHKTGLQKHLPVFYD